MSARLSVIVPFFNVESYIRACLRSLATQSFRDLEVIMVDDGSSDGSRAVAEEYCAADGRFTLVEQENQGLGPARNVGVAHATGEFLAFADSDDLVPHFGYELLMGSLAQSRSDIAAGDARRFTSLWVRDSYAHRLPFARTSIETHVRENALIALDRMAWNKVYRRAHWDEQALEFPSMLYEDYPVVIKAQVTAAAVDILEHPVYYWREREGGEPSITQSKWQLANLEDRVRSAELVLDYLEEHAPSVLPVVEKHFVDVDLDAVVGAIHEAPDVEVPQIVALGQRLLSRISDDVRWRCSPFERVQAVLLETDDQQALKVLLDHRDEHGTHANIVQRGRGNHRYMNLPFLDDQAVGIPLECYRVQRPKMKIATSVADGAWVDGDFVVSGTAHIRDLPLDRGSTMRIWVRDLEGNRIDLPLTRTEVPIPDQGRQLAGFEVRLNPHLLRAVRDRSGSWKYFVEIQQSGVTVVRPLTLGTMTRARWALQEPLSDTLWAQPQAHGRGELRVAVRRPREIADEFLASPGVFVIRGHYRARAGDPDPVLELTRHDSVTRVIAGAGDTEHGSLRSFEFRVDLVALGLEAEFDAMEEPVSWAARVRLGTERRPLAVAAKFGGGVLRLGDTHVRVTRSQWGNLVIQQSRAAAFVDYLSWGKGSRIDVGGEVGPMDEATALQLHRYVTPELPVVVDVPARVHLGRFTASFDVSELIDAALELERRRRRRHEHPTPWHLVLSGPAGRRRLSMPRDLLWTLPERRTVTGHETVFVIGRGDALAVMTK